MTRLPASTLSALATCARAGVSSVPAYSSGLADAAPDVEIIDGSFWGLDGTRLTWDGVEIVAVLGLFGRVTFARVGGPYALKTSPLPSPSL